MVKRIKTKRKHRRKYKKRSQKIKFKPIYKKSKNKKYKKQIWGYNNHKELIDSFIDNGDITKDSKIHTALMKVDRGDYCDGTKCYLDSPSSIGYEQTISAPHMHIKALKYLEDKLIPGSKILDIGSGSGYLTAVFGYLVETNEKDNKSLVYGIDIYDELVKNSLNNIKKNNSDLLNHNKLNIIVGDGWAGYPDKNLLFDAIHVGASADELPINLWRQLKPGGKLIIPIQTEQREVFRLYNKPTYWNRICNIKPYECYKKNLFDVRYVPLQKNNKLISN